MICFQSAMGPSYRALHRIQALDTWTRGHVDDRRWRKAADQLVDCTYVRAPGEKVSARTIWATPITTSERPNSHHSTVAAHSGESSKAMPATMLMTAKRTDQIFDDPDDAQDDPQQRPQHLGRRAQVQQGDHASHEEDQTERDMPEAGPAGQCPREHAQADVRESGQDRIDGDARGDHLCGLARPEQDQDSDDDRDRAQQAQRRPDNVDAGAVDANHAVLNHLQFSWSRFGLSAERSADFPAAA